MSNRDTQFSGFAMLLMRDLDAASTTTYASFDKAKEAYELAIVRRAYDFAEHIALETERLAMEEVRRYYGDDDVLHGIEDMTEWPEEQGR